jgi:hypothetical protein
MFQRRAASDEGRVDSREAWRRAWWPCVDASQEKGGRPDTTLKPCLRVCYVIICAESMVMENVQDAMDGGASVVACCRGRRAGLVAVAVVDMAGTTYQAVQNESI